MDEEMKAAMTAAENFDPDKVEESAAPVEGAVDSAGNPVEVPEEKENNVNYCPTCEELFQSRARCLQLESRCSQGHVWHVCAVHGKIMEGKPSDTGYVCTCGAEHGGPLLKG